LLAVALKLSNDLRVRRTKHFIYESHTISL